MLIMGSYVSWNIWAIFSIHSTTGSFLVQRTFWPLDFNNSECLQLLSLCLIHSCPAGRYFFTVSILFLSFALVPLVWASWSNYDQFLIHLLSWFRFYFGSSLLSTLYNILYYSSNRIHPVLGKHIFIDWK